MRVPFQCLCALIACVLLVPSVCAAGVGLHLVLDAHHAHERVGDPTHSEAIHAHSAAQDSAHAAPDAAAHAAVDELPHGHATDIDEQTAILRLLPSPASTAQLRTVEVDVRPTVAAAAPFPDRPPLSIPLFTTHCSLLI